MRRLIVVALISAMVGAVLALWAKSTVLATGVHVLPAGAGLSPFEIMRSAKHLPVQVIETPY